MAKTVETDPPCNPVNPRSKRVNRQHGHMDDIAE
jgi:hypothetical protein